MRPSRFRRFVGGGTLPSLLVVAAGHGAAVGGSRPPKPAPSGQADEDSGAEDAVGRSGSAGRLERRDEHAAAAAGQHRRERRAQRRGSRRVPAAARARPDARSPRRRPRRRRQPRVQRALDGRAAAEDHRRPPHVADRRSAGRPDSAARCRCRPSGRRCEPTRGAAPRVSTPGCPTVSTDMSLPVRCIIRTDSPPYLPTIYNNDFQIFQSPGYVAIAPEMIHSARIIPLDGRPHLDKNLQQWLGDTRGHWEGNDARRRDDELPNRRWRGVPGRQSRDVTRSPSGSRASRRHDQLRVHGRGSDDVDEAVDGGDPVDKVDPDEQMYRVRVSRRQLRHRAPPDRRARAGEERRALKTAACRREVDAMRTIQSSSAVVARARRRSRRQRRPITRSPRSSTRTSPSSSRARSRR